MQTPLRILVIEDNPDLAANLTDFLEARGHLPEVAADGINGFRRATTGAHDVIILDLVLPGRDGITLCRQLRADCGLTTPILMLTARDSIEDKIAGLEAGADDYVVKPFLLREVEVRVRALARRATGGSPRQRLQVGDLSYDTATYAVHRGPRPLELPPIPLRLLETLMRASPRVVSRDELERSVWGDELPDSDALRAHLHVLRSAVDKPFDRPLVRTLRGLGWQLIADDDKTPAS